ncbi:hypothetical protein BGX28_003330 [Mortierella sp. GBA30]|nr:hypothetical protein BGX28_003330 [Mortierella sp. GBA30]
MFSSGTGPQGGALNGPYGFLSFGLWNYCYGTGDSVAACSRAKLAYTLGDIPALYKIEQEFVPDAVRNIGKITFVFIPVTCVAFLTLIISFIALLPKFRKRWLHVIASLLSLLVTLACIVLMVVVFTVFGARKIQFDLHMVPEVTTMLGPSAWIALGLGPWTVFGSLLSACAICCPDRFKKKKPEEELLIESEEKVDKPSSKA